MRKTNKMGQFITVPIQDRFWEYVVIKRQNECWEWIGWKVGGYGRIKVGGVKQLAHRVSWILHNKTNIPVGFHILHSCDNPPCVNPKHLWLGTHQENMKDMGKKNRTRNRFTGKLVAPTTA